MNFVQCFNFCNNHRNVINTFTPEGNIRITNLIPAPTNPNLFHRFLEIAIRQNSVHVAAAITGARNFQPLLILESSPHLLLYSWYAFEFPFKQDGGA